ncbi:ImmA/IrrE family metallo-endopeptidase [Pseudarthrobacter psychrotolerans]|uniref:ImmA/IrrE family metallo-endopeptidase n=1 Tax=Pseudarthrobacter psychrotolerans TaxID=2697569 RepID=A0A6P1NGU2_9MICC|nr:ImmA/IrrE family metallo-endopeptidase [Pseudarthrobacter psychrotolerans]QHK19855.1 ImmA/IrrE family metallo-endopeptidase [Pseudarthrobacter psychrotolerans]
MTNEINPTPFDRSVLSTLRSLIPNREVHSLAEAKQIAEHQAIRLLQLHSIGDGPVPIEFIAELPKIEIELVEAPVSGASFWNGNAWIIQLNRHENYRRQRFTLAHEYKHIIDHNRADGLYLGSKDLSAAEQAEHAADYFAGCLLVPKMLLKRAYYGGMQKPSDLANHFQVSEVAIVVRLRQTGIAEPSPRCQQASTPFSRSWQYRMNSRTQPQGV